jgi:putative Holliday junction resolvase
MSSEPAFDTPQAPPDPPAADGHEPANGSSETSGQPTTLPPRVPKGRLLGLDYGARRVGVAVSDVTGSIASPRGRIEFRQVGQLLDRLATLLADEEEIGPIVGIVVGDPRHMSGAPSEGSQEAAQLAAELRRRFGLPVWMWDERLTTVAAEATLAETGLRGERRRRKVDAVAASLILQSFLEALRERGDSPHPRRGP